MSEGLNYENDWIRVFRSNMPCVFNSYFEPKINKCNKSNTTGSFYLEPGSGNPAHSAIFTKEQVIALFPITKWIEKLPGLIMIRRLVLYSWVKHRLAFL